MGDNRGRRHCRSTKLAQYPQKSLFEQSNDLPELPLSLLERLRFPRKIFCSPPKKTTPPRTHSMALPLKELQKGLSDDRRSPFLLFTRHSVSRGPKIAVRESGGCCPRAQRWSRRLGFIESSNVTQSSATTSQIHPPPSATTVADRSVLRESRCATCLLRLV